MAGVHRIWTKVGCCCFYSFCQKISKICVQLTLLVGYLISSRHKSISFQVGILAFVRRVTSNTLMTCVHKRNEKKMKCWNGDGPHTHISAQRMQSNHAHVMLTTGTFYCTASAINSNHEWIFHVLKRKIATYQLTPRTIVHLFSFISMPMNHEFLGSYKISPNKIKNYLMKELPRSLHIISQFTDNATAAALSLTCARAQVQFSQFKANTVPMSFRPEN